jgi:tRNA dimethylallyltransferase
VPHCLFGVVDGADAMSAVDWASQTLAAIRGAHTAERLPILVGGTGLYIRTLLDGIAPVPPIDATVRAEVRGLTLADIRDQLVRHDPVAAARLGPNDLARNARALEVILSTGRSLTAWQQERVGGIAGQVDVTGIVLLPPRNWLRARCDMRFDMMLDQGGIAEVEALLQRRLPSDAPVMKAIGVREIAAMLDDPANRAPHIEAAKAATRQYAKRQYTWFRNQLPETWVQIETQLESDCVDKLVIKLRDRLLTR